MCVHVYLGSLLAWPREGGRSMEMVSVQGYVCVCVCVCVIQYVCYSAHLTRLKKKVRSISMLN